MIVMDGLSKHFGPVRAVDGLTLAVDKGEVLGFLGPNGAGKTTTMRMLAGFLEPSRGRAAICGFDVATESIAAKRRLGYLPEGAPLYGDMTCAAFLAFVAEIRGYRGAARRQRLAEIVDTVALGDVLERPIDTLSKGYKRRVGLAQAMLHDPPVLILDEPTDGLDPNQKHHVRELIRGMGKEKAIIVSTHILEEVESVCTRAVVIAQGRIAADGTAESLLARLPRHNAVRLVVPAGAADAAAMVLREVATPQAVERLPAADGLVTFYVLAHEGTAPLAAVAHELHAHSIEVDSLGVERGRLDDVFRALTAPEGARPEGTSPEEAKPEGAGPGHA